MLEVVYEGMVDAGSYDISYHNENLETGTYQKVFEVNGQILSRNFYFCNY